MKSIQILLKFKIFLYLIGVLFVFTIVLILNFFYVVRQSLRYRWYQIDRKNQTCISYRRFLLKRVVHQFRLFVDIYSSTIRLVK